MFVRPIHDAPTPDEKDLSKRKEDTRKDTERLFEVLQACFRVLLKGTEYCREHCVHEGGF